jgi:VanZ family protein
MPGLRACSRIAFAIGIASVIVFSLLPADSLPSLGVSDKFEHFGVYALLALIAGFAFPTQRAADLLIIILSTLGIALELGQWFVPGRSPETVDAIASGLGACTILALYLWLRSRSASLRRNKRIELISPTTPIALAHRSNHTAENCISSE